MKKDLLYPLVYLVLLSICIAGFSVSKYQNSVGGSDSATVARPVVNIVPEDATFTAYDNTVTTYTADQLVGGITLPNLQPGSTLVYDFKVRNYDDNNNLNQVTMKYRLSAVFEPNSVELPLTADIEPRGSYGAAGGWTPMGYDAPADHEYTLTVTWVASDDSGDYTDKNQNINVTVDAEQVD